MARFRKPHHESQGELFDDSRVVFRSRYQKYALPYFGTLAAVGLTMVLASCAGFPMCNLHLENGRLILDQCMAQDLKPQRGSDEKPATKDPEESPG